MPISFNPALTTAPQNSFILETEGWIQGLTQDDPISRMYLQAGQIANGVTQPVWGGMGVAVTTVTGAQSNGSGDIITPASTTHIDGFTVFDQAINMMQTPGNTAPTAYANQSVAYYLFGMKARVPLPLAAGVISGLEGVSVGLTPIYWDTVNFNITLTSSANTIALPSDVKILAVSENSRNVAYNSTSGAVSWLDGQDAGLFLL